MSAPRKTDPTARSSASHGCDQGRACPARSGGSCACTEAVDDSVAALKIYAIAACVVATLYAALPALIRWWSK